MEIYGNYCEKTFRKNYFKTFTWIDFNIELGNHLFQTSSRKAIAIDPSYISKSGKFTQGVGQFWSGCAQAVKHGLEILGIGLIDIDHKDCVSLRAVQTPSPKSLTECGLSLPKWYLTSILANKEKLIGLSRCIVADSYFAIFEFVDGLTREDLFIVSRFRSNAALMYLHEGEPTERKADRENMTERLISTISTWGNLVRCTSMPTKAASTPPSYIPSPSSAM